MPSVFRLITHYEGINTDKQRAVRRSKSFTTKPLEETPKRMNRQISAGIQLFDKPHEKITAFGSPKSVKKGDDWKILRTSGSFKKYHLSPEKAVKTKVVTPKMVDQEARIDLFEQKFQDFCDKQAQKSMDLEDRVFLLELEVKTLRLRCTELEDRLKKPNNSAFSDCMNDAFYETDSRREANSTTNSTISQKTSSPDEAFLQGDSNMTHDENYCPPLSVSKGNRNPTTSEYIEMLLSKYKEFK